LLLDISLRLQRLHTIQYGDGTSERLDMRNETWCLAPAAEAPAVAATAPPAAQNVRAFLSLGSTPVTRIVSSCRDLLSLHYDGECCFCVQLHIMSTSMHVKCYSSGHHFSSVQKAADSTQSQKQSAGKKAQPHSTRRPATALGELRGNRAASPEAPAAGQPASAMASDVQEVPI